MGNLSQYSAKSADWRGQLQLNARRTKYVIGTFILIYLAIGLLVDLYIHSGVHAATNGYTYQPQPLLPILKQLLTLQIIPFATIIMGLIATISVWITFKFHDKLMLLGTEYHEVTSPATELAEQQLYNVVEEMKVAAGLHFMPKVYIIEADYMNAFASGYSEKSALMAITRGLMQKLNRAELQAVIAHELSHIRHHDIKLTLAASVLSNLLLMAIDALFYGVIFGRNRSRDNRLVVVIMILRFLLPIITIVMMLYLSRTREYMADAGAVELTRDNAPLANALMKISGDYQQNIESYNKDHRATAHEDVRRAAYIFEPTQAGAVPVHTVATLFSTHPSLKDRLKAIGFSRKEIKTN